MRNSLFEFAKEMEKFFELSLCAPQLAKILIVFIKIKRSLGKDVTILEDKFLHEISEFEDHEIFGICSSFGKSFTEYMPLIISTNHNDNIVRAFRYLIRYHSESFFAYFDRITNLRINDITNRILLDVIDERIQALTKAFATDYLPQHESFANYVVQVGTYGQSTSFIERIVFLFRETETTPFCNHLETALLERAPTHRLFELSARIPNIRSKVFIVLTQRPEAGYMLQRFLESYPQYKRLRTFA